jgi:hypothetical protein
MWRTIRVRSSLVISSRETTSLCRYPHSIATSVPSPTLARISYSSGMLMTLLLTRMLVCYYLRKLRIHTTTLSGSAVHRITCRNRTSTARATSSTTSVVSFPSSYSCSTTHCSIKVCSMSRVSSSSRRRLSTSPSTLVSQLLIAAHSCCRISGECRLEITWIYT